MRQLEYFMAICEELHFSRAAERMGVSDPNISQQIRALEEELGVLPFDRIGRKIALTEAGAILKEHGTAVFGHLRQAGDAIADLKLRQGGSWPSAFCPATPICCSIPS
ncbi:LysR family transcriptional regulator [Cohnella zeiphila]|uniref:LysR family transcriptional regulator n=1 Tax=Cohnella zeiphila TaxID=2761120 RepID=UPI003B585EEA